MDENGRETDGEYGGGYERSAKGRRYQGRVKIDFAGLRMRSVRESYGIERKEDMKPGIYTRWGRARTHVFVRSHGAYFNVQARCVP